MKPQRANILYAGIGTIAALLVASASIAQEAQVARPKETPYGSIGQRQTREEVAPNAKPLERLENRLDNRVKSRLATRLDRYYDPNANAVSDVQSAIERARTPLRRYRR